MNDHSPPEADFARVERSLPIALLQAREAVMERFRPMLHRLDVTEQQWRVLRVLHEAPGLDATALAARACILAPSLTRILRALEGRGLVVISRDPGDARRSLLALSDAGARFINDAAGDSAAAYARIEDHVGAARISALLDELEAVTAALRAGR